MAATIEVPAVVMAAAAKAGEQQLKSLIEKERSVDGFTDNAEEMAATNAFFDSLVPTASVSDGMVRFSIPDSNDQWGNTIEEGTSPVSGGQGGSVTHPDGHQEPSRVPIQLQGTPLPWLSAAGVTWKDNVIKQAQTLIPEAISSVISEYSEEISKSVRPYIEEILASALGGSA